MDQATIRFRLQGKTRYDEATGIFLSFCPRLDIYAQGHSKDEAMDALKSSILLYVETCYEHKILDDVMFSAGFTRAQKKPARDMPQSVEYISIEMNKPKIAPAKFDSTFDFDMDIPLNLVAAEASQSADLPHTAPCV